MPKFEVRPTDFVEFYDNVTNQWLRGTVIEVEKWVSDFILDHAETGHHFTVTLLLEDGELKNLKHRWTDDIRIIQRVKS